MRILLGVLVVLSVAWVIAESETPAPAPPAPPPKTVVEAKRHDCRDLCEQTAIVEKLSDAVLARCLARCAGGPASPKWEPISRITVAPADHHSTIATEPPPSAKR